MPNLYVTAQEIKEQAIGSEAETAPFWASLAESSSRIFDRACGVSDGCFNKAGAAATTKIFRGDGTDYLRLAPYIAESLTLVEWLDSDDVVTEVDAEDYFERDGYLIYANAGVWGWDCRTAYSNPRGYFKMNRRYRVTAIWGFSEIPAEVKQAVIELALFIWRRKDLAFSDMSGVATAVVAAQMPPTTEMVVEKYKGMYSELGYFG